MNKTKGFSLIELLVVMVILAVVIVALISAINPLEQIRKAKDARRLKDAGDLLGGYARYFGTYRCHVWDPGAPDCTGESTSRLNNPVVADFSATGEDYELIRQNTLKEAFVERDSIENGEMLVSNDDERRVAVCFEPESKKSRNGAFIPLTDNLGKTPIPGKVCADPDGYPDASCYICVSI